MAWKNPANQDATVFQDGADFYITESDDFGAEFTATAPFGVKDHDIEAAERARVWFLNTYTNYNFTWEA